MSRLLHYHDNLTGLALNAGHFGCTFLIRRSLFHQRFLLGRELDHGL